jgi:hypothetical protein
MYILLMLFGIFGFPVGPGTMATPDPCAPQGQGPTEPTPTWMVVTTIIIVVVLALGMFGNIMHDIREKRKRRGNYWEHHK